jgi:hypothetical protein
VEDISLGYAIAQSVLFKIYGNSIQETGHLTKGHVCLTDADKVNAGCVKGSLLYGELLPRGANKVCFMRYVVCVMWYVCALCPLVSCYIQL